jgi:hypothetical protein
MQIIGKTLPGFYERLERLAGEIGKVLEEGREDESPEAGDEDRETVRAAFSTLRAALEEKDMKRIDKLLEEIEGLSLDAKNREAVDAVSDQVLMGEYQGAIDFIDATLQEN